MVHFGCQTYVNPCVSYIFVWRWIHLPSSDYAKMTFNRQPHRKPPFVSLAREISRRPSIGVHGVSADLSEFSEKNGLNRLQMVKFECPRHSNPCASLRLGEFHFLIFLGNKGNGLWGIRVKRCKIFRTKWAQQAANGPLWMPQALKPMCLTMGGRIPFSRFPGEPAGARVLNLAKHQVQNMKN